MRPRPFLRPSDLQRPLRLHWPLLLALCALWPAFGCGEAGGGSSFDFARHFAPEDAIVEDRSDETMLRMQGIRFASGTADLTPDSLPVLTEEISLRYLAGDRCWEDLDAEIIVVGDADESAYCTAPETGEVAAGRMSVFQLPSFNVDGCIADLDWSVWVERVGR